MNYASFDLEIMKEIPDDCENWDELGPLGISCAAIATDDNEVAFWYSPAGLSTNEASNMVDDFLDYVSRGYTLLTWNGLSFDFKVLANVSGRLDDCARLALNHVDMMLFITFQKGYYLGLDKALSGANIEGKLKHVRLNDGTSLDDMSGAKAPTLWAAGEHKAVLEYLRYDVTQPLELAHKIETTKRITWTSGRGRPMLCRISRMLTAIQCFDLPKPNTSWMTDPPTREQFIRWIPKAIFEQVQEEASQK